MDFKIVWVDEAWEEFRNIINYITENWSPEIAKRFRTYALEKVNLLSSNPYIGKKAERAKGHRKLVITKPNTIYYEISGDEIFILRFFDTRQHPRRLKRRNR